MFPDSSNETDEGHDSEYVCEGITEGKLITNHGKYITKYRR